MSPIAPRLKDAIWSVRKEYGLEADIDRVFPFIALEQNLTLDQLNGLFADRPKRTPFDFGLALFARIKQTVYYYWQYKQTGKGYHRVVKGIIFLENVVRHGEKGCRLVEDQSVGFVLELKR